MGQLLLFIVVALVVAAIVFGVTVMVSGGDSGLTPVEPDGRSVPLPSDRPLGEEDVIRAKFDTALRGYRMSQVDQALQRAAYDIGYKSELIGVLEAEVTALRDGRIADADVLRRAREAAVEPASLGGTPAASPEAEHTVAPAGAVTWNSGNPAADASSSSPSAAVSSAALPDAALPDAALSGGALSGAGSSGASEPADGEADSDRSSGTADSPAAVEAEPSVEAE